MTEPAELLSRLPSPLRDTVRASLEAGASQGPRATIEPAKKKGHGTLDDALKLLRELGAEGALSRRGTLGEGGMGVVHLAEQRALGREVAVKSLKTDARTAETTLKLLREAWITGTLEHPNVIPVHDVGTYTPVTVAEGPPTRSVFVVMELVEGEDLERWLDRGPRPWEQTLEVFLSAGRGLAAAHGAGILHRDFKPSNVLVGTDGRVRVVDFGLARPVASDDTEGDRRDPSGDVAALADIHTRTGTVLGTPYYMAPELLGGGEASERSDQYAFAVALYTGLFGHGPFLRGSVESVTRAKRAGNIVPVPEDTKVPGWLAEVVWRGLSPRPEARFASMNQLLHTIEHLRHRRRRRVTITAAGVGACAAIAIGLGLGRLPEAPVVAPPVVVAPPAEVARVEPTPVLAFLPFTGASDGELGWSTPNGLPNLMFEEIRDQPGLRALPYFRLKEQLGAGPPATWPATARRAGATILISGTIERRDGALELHVVARDLDDAVVAERVVRSDEVGLAEAARAVARDVTAEATGRPFELAQASAWPITYERALQLGVAALEQFDFDTAQLHLDEARKLAPAAAEAHFYGAILADWLGRNDEAHEEYRLAANGTLDAAKRAYVDGALLRSKGGHPGAVEHFREARAQFPDDIYLAYGLFEVLYHSGLGVEAVAEFAALQRLAPRFGTGLTHVMEQSAATGDRAALRSAIEAAVRTEHDAGLVGIWRGRLALLEGDLTGALAVFEPLAETHGEALDFAIAVHAIRGDMTLARARITQATARGDSHLAAAEIGLCTAMGDDACRDEAVARERARILRAARSDAAALGWLVTALHESLRPGADLDAIAQATDAAAQGMIRSDLRFEIAALFLADARADEGAIVAAKASRYAEVAALAEAMSAGRAGEHEVAAKHWRRALQLGVEGRFQIAQRYRLAESLRALGDDAGVVATCDAVATPPNFSWSWGAAVGPCLLWAAQASAKLGDREGALERYRRLLSLRIRADGRDALVVAAKAGIAAIEAAAGPQ